MRKRKRRKKIVRSEFQNVLNFLIGKQLIEIYNATNPAPKTEEKIIDIPYEEIKSEATDNIYLSQVATDEHRARQKPKIET